MSLSNEKLLFLDTHLSSITFGTFRRLCCVRAKFLDGDYLDFLKIVSRI